MTDPADELERPSPVPDAPAERETAGQAADADAEAGDARPQPPGARRTVLVRYSGEITTKARPTRQRFVTRVSRNLKDALRSEGLRGQVDRRHDRLYLHIEGDTVPEALAHVFGVQSLAPVEQREWRSLDDLVRHGVGLYGDAVAGKRFAVRGRRVGDKARVPLRTKEVEFAVGGALHARSAGVDLSSPEVTVHVEVSPGQASFFLDSSSGPGGLPLGVEGRAVALVSGGFDSAVASWQIQRRGVTLDYVFCNLGGRTHQLGTLRVMKHIADHWSYGVRPHFHAIDFEAVSADLQRACTTRYWQVVLKRLMLRAAEKIAEERGAPAIVTGEAIGQVSSQTLQNLAAITHGTRLPVLRPLVGSNKDEILRIARAIGTYDLSKVVGEYCALVPSRPATAASVEVIDAEYAKLDTSLLDRAVEGRSIFNLRALDLATLDDPALQIDAIDADATVIDLRSKAAYGAWHYPGALFLDFPNAMRAYDSFDRSKRYVLYCEFGLKSAHLAERMCDAGMQAASFAGGLRALMDYAGAGAGAEELAGSRH